MSDETKTDLKIYFINFKHTVQELGAVALEAPSEEEAKAKLIKMANKMNEFEITDCVDVTSVEYMQKQMEAEKKAQAEYDKFMEELMNDSGAEETDKEPTIN